MTDRLSAIKQALTDAQSVLSEFMSEEASADFILELADAVCDSFENKGRVYIAGNGGSHCDAMHFAEEFTGRYRESRVALPAMALGDAAHQSCVSNDYGFEEVFARQVEAFGQPGDTLILLSTSGNSKNLIRAAETSKEKSVKTFSLLGKGGGELKAQSDKSIVVPGQTSDRIQEIHMMMLHIVIEAVERKLFPDHYS
jgi:D-sedoheptulose 7-phosphate isomerase